MKDNKELYDLCRKYKYFYKKLKDLKEFKRKYYDANLTGNIVDTTNELHSIERKMFPVILDNEGITISSMSTEISHIHEPVYDSVTRMSTHIESNTNGYGEICIECKNAHRLSELLRNCNNLGGIWFDERF